MNRVFGDGKARPANLLLESLCADETPELLRGTVPIELPAGMRLSEPGRAVEYVFFPVSGTIATDALTRRGESTLISLIGTEGFAGWCGLLDHPQHMHSVVVQTPGRALRLKISAARQEFERGEAFTRLAHAFMYMQMAQISQSVLCNRFHSVSERLARWILELRARCDGEQLLVTHELLARMLGARRSSVTVAATEMQERGLIEYRRGKVRILDLPQLESTACECYGIVQQAYRHMLRVYGAQRPEVAEQRPGAGPAQDARSDAAPTDHAGEAHL